MQKMNVDSQRCPPPPQNKKHRISGISSYTTAYSVEFFRSLLIGRMKQRPKWGAAAAWSEGLSRGKENVAANTAAAKAKPKARCVAVA